MRILVVVLGVLAVLIGVVFFALAFLAPHGSNLAGASAVQITQVYSEASYDALMSIAAFAFAGLCASAAAYPRIRLPQNISNTTNR
jgi:hypothetical protein